MSWRPRAYCSSLLRRRQVSTSQLPAALLVSSMGVLIHLPLLPMPCTFLIPVHAPTSSSSGFGRFSFNLNQPFVFTWVSPGQLPPPPAAPSFSWSFLLVCTVTLSSLSSISLSPQCPLLSFFFVYLLYVWRCFAFMYACELCVCSIWGGQQASESLELTTDGCQPLCGWWELNLSQVPIVLNFWVVSLAPVLPFSPQGKSGPHIR